MATVLFSCLGKNPFIVSTLQRLTQSKEPVVHPNARQRLKGHAQSFSPLLVETPSFHLLRSKTLASSLPPRFTSGPMFVPSANTVSTAFKIYPESDHFLPALPLLNHYDLCRIMMIVYWPPCFRLCFLGVNVQHSPPHSHISHLNL